MREAEVQAGERLPPPSTPASLPPPSPPISFVLKPRRRKEELAVWEPLPQPFHSNSPRLLWSTLTSGRPLLLPSTPQPPRSLSSTGVPAQVELHQCLTPPSICTSLPIACAAM
eukprot:1909684-Rhodomonas_salina.1